MDACTAQRSGLPQLKRSSQPTPPKNSLKSKPVHYTWVSGSLSPKKNSCINSATLNWNFSLKYYIWQTQQTKQAWASELLRDFKSKHTLFNKDILSSLLPGCSHSPTKFSSILLKVFLVFFLMAAGRLDLGNGNARCHVCLTWQLFGWVFALFSKHTKRAITPMNTSGYWDLSKLCFSVLSLPLNEQPCVSSTLFPHMTSSILTA